MTFDEVLKLFEKACERKDWGDTSHLILFNDGSGYIVDKDGDRLFEFEDVDELIRGLKG